MSRMVNIASRAEELLQTSVIATAPAAGGDINTATKLRLSDGSTALMKTHPNPPADFYQCEARGLRRLAQVDGGVPVPSVLAVADDCLIMRWVEPGKTLVEYAGEFGTRLARTHAAGADSFGAEQDGFIATLPMRNTSANSWAEFYATQRVLPYLHLAHKNGKAETGHVSRIEAIIAKLPQLIPEEPPALLHGDLWGGNLVWGLEVGIHLIDPATYAGHREVDLAMMALFGVPHLQRIIEAYDDAAPLADGWEERVGLHQLFPLLVHACLFGGGYAERAATIADRFA